MPEEETDSVAHHRKRRDRMEKESKEMQERNANEQDLANQGIIRPGETRDQLLARILAMREQATRPQERPPAPVVLSEGQRKQLELEQEAGRQAVAKSEALAEMVRQQIAARAAAEGEKNRT